MTAASARSAVVTGASRGIGAAVAACLAGAGYRVALLARGAGALEAAASRAGNGSFAVPCDLTDHAQVEAAVHRVLDALGEAPGVLVNSAGAFTLARVDATSLADFRAALEVNLVAPFRLVRAFLPGMRARRSGHIVSIGSISDRVAFPENGAYSASKFGLRGLHEVLRAELRGSGVRSTLVSPSAVDTPLWDSIDPDSRPGFSPRAQMLSADAVAAAVVSVVAQPADVNVDELRLSRS